MNRSIESWPHGFNIPNSSISRHPPCATVGLCIESANVVGYQNKGMTLGELNSVCATFVTPGTDGSTMTLGNLKPTGTTWDGSSIIFLNGNGGTDKFTDPNLGEVKKQFYYLNATEAAEFGCDEGWYQYSDEDSEYLMNDIAIPYGQGIMFNCKDSGATLGFSGEVKDGAEISMALGKFNFTGNVTPTDLKLGDFSCTNTTWDGSSIIFLNKNGGTAKFTDSDLGEVKKQFYFLNATEAAEFELDAGWYQYSDEDSEYPMNLKINVAAGEGFLFNCKDSGAKLIVPKVLNK